MPSLKSKVRGFRWSLRTLLVIVTGCALLMGAWSIYVKPYHIQLRAAEALVKAGGFVETQPSGPTWMRAIVGQDKMVDVVRVELQLGDFTDSDLEHLTDLPYVYHLIIKAPRVTDQGLKHLAEMGELTDLVLSDTAVSDSGLAHLRPLTKLRKLMIYGNTQVTSVGVEDLKKELRQLEIIH